MFPQSGFYHRAARREVVRTAVIAVLAGLLATAAAVTVRGTVPPAPPAAPEDFAGLVDIGGRRLYLECQGTGSPTVVLEAGYRDRADIWRRDSQQPAGSRAMALPTIAGFSRVCAYDRPGTYTTVEPDLSPAAADEGILPSRSDPAVQPRTAADVVADLHALLQSAGIPGPYVLVGRSLGGMFVRLYTATYPDEVVGLVLVDATHEDVWVQFRAQMTPTQWAAFEPVQFDLAPNAEYPALERIDAIASTVLMRQARAAAPLRPMPLAVLAHSRPFDYPSPDWPGDAMEAIMLAMNTDLATLAPNARLSIASQSGHYVHQDQPGLVTEAIRQVVVGVRDRDTWYDLGSCCAR